MCPTTDDAFTVVTNVGAFVTSAEGVPNTELLCPEKGVVAEDHSSKRDAGLFGCLFTDDVPTETAKTERDTVKDASYTKLPCPEKGGVVEIHNFKGDVELFGCLSIDAVPTETTKTERNTVELSNVTCNHDREGDNSREVTVITSNVEVVNNKDINIQSLITRTLESRMVVQSKAMFWQRSICCKLGNTRKSSVTLITTKLFSVKSTVLTQSCRVVNNPLIVFKDR
jgi:hypothetical protein